MKNEITDTSDTKTPNNIIISARDLNVYYGDFRAVKDVNLDVQKNKVLSLIGPSGCGKSTVLRCFNRMNDLVLSAAVQGSILYNGIDLYSSEVDATEIRSSIGMVFQKPNPFPKSIFDNVAFGLRINGYRGDIDEAVEKSLKQAALWDEVKDRQKIAV